MYLDSNNAFQEKKVFSLLIQSQFSFTLSTPKGDKSAGVVIIDLAVMLNNKIHSLEDNFRIDKCPDKDARVFIRVTAEALGENLLSQMSSATGVQAQSLMSIPMSETMIAPAKREKEVEEDDVTRLENENSALKEEIKALKVNYQ